MTRGAATDELLRLRKLCQRRQATINRLQDELAAERLARTTAAARRCCCAEDDTAPTLWQRVLRWWRRP
jgi:hypothetical protein